jgi:hypothetical protein
VSSARPESQSGHGEDGPIDLSLGPLTSNWARPPGPGIGPVHCEDGAGLTVRAECDGWSRVVLVP